MENTTEYHKCECGNTYIAGPKRLVDPLPQIQVIRDSQRERRRCALLQAAAIIRSSEWSATTQSGAVDEAEGLLAEIERREK
jgi:hypothetical protein